MKWPFVSRARLEAAVAMAGEARSQRVAAEMRADKVDAAWRADYSALVQTANANDTAWSERYGALLEKYHELRLQGGNAAEIRPVLSVAKPSGPIADAIDDVCEKFGNSVKLRRRLMKYAADARQDAPDMDEADIAHAIRHWRDPDEDEAA